MSFKISAENALLGILVEGPKHGYELHGYVATEMNQFWNLSMSQVYALLKRMEHEGMVVSRQEWQGTRPPKKIFALTSRGREGFLHWVSTPVRHIRDIRIEFMAKLFFAGKLCSKERITLVEKQIALLDEKLDVIKNSKEKSADEFQALIYSFKVSQTNAILSWLRQCKTSFLKYKGKATG
jgi:PadR family transcriptional regulator, regulatory protein AphA